MDSQVLNAFDELVRHLVARGYVHEDTAVHLIDLNNGVQRDNVENVARREDVTTSPIVADTKTEKKRPSNE